MCHGQILDISIRKAHKRHLCESCGKGIEIGHRYEDQTQVDEIRNRMEHVRLCRSCAIACHAILEADPPQYEQCVYFDVPANEQLGYVMREPGLRAKVRAACKRIREKFRKKERGE